MLITHVINTYETYKKDILSIISGISYWLLFKIVLTSILHLKNKNMNKNQLNRFEMHNAVINYLNLHSEKWSSIPKIGTIKNEFGVIQEQIVNSKEAQQSAQVFVGQTKLSLKSTIAQKTDILNDALEAFALIEGNSALENRMSSSYSDIYAMRNANFTTIVQEVVLEADTNKDPLLTEYGVTEEQIEDLKIDLNPFPS